MTISSWQHDFNQNKLPGERMDGPVLDETKLVGLDEFGLSWQSLVLVDSDKGSHMFHFIGVDAFHGDAFKTCAEVVRSIHQERGQRVKQDGLGVLEGRTFESE